MRSLADSLAAIYRTEGVRGLWKGSIPSIIKVRGRAGVGWGSTLRGPAIVMLCHSHTLAW